MECKICKKEAIYHDYSIERDNQAVDCHYCGKYYLVSSFETDTYEDASNFYKVSSWIREQNDEWNNHPNIDRYKFKKILGMRDKKIQEKFDLMMNYLTECPENQLLKHEVLIKCWLKDFGELDKIFTEMKNRGFIEGERAMEGILFEYITFQGLQHIESLEEPNKNLKNIFIAFKFTNELKPIFENQVKDIIEELGFNYTVVNQETTPHDQKITDEIIAKLKSSRMIIADFTDNSTNVYFEAGFAMGMKIPVIWTCKKGHDFSFDTGQFPHITWEDADDLKNKLRNRINAII